MSAWSEQDLKKIVALSTLSQLGLMLIRIGLGWPILAFIHLIVHAMLKALLLICAGVLIHFHGHSQDIRQVGIICRQIPFTRSAISVSRLSLCAVPLMSGFYSKDIILEGLLWAPLRLLAVFLGLLATVLTRAYSFRLFFSSIFCSVNSVPMFKMKETIKFPIVNLCIGAIAGGAIIFRACGPLVIESLIPGVKISITLSLFLGLAIGAISLYKARRFTVRDLTIKYYRRSCAIIELTSLTTQKILFGSLLPIKQIALADQSWLELGKSKF